MKPCCENLENRAEGPGPRGWAGIEAVADRADTSVTHCAVCECRHLEAEAEAGAIGVRGSSL